MSAIQVFAFDSSAVRTIMIDGEPWFVAKDVAEILGYSETEKMTRRLDDDEVQKIASPELGGANSMAREFTIINESGLYASVLGSNKPEAKVFKKWVTSELLPSIRKHGAYALDGSHAQKVENTSGRFTNPNLVVPEHEANMLVTADRTFRAAIRTGAAMGLNKREQLRNANMVTIRTTGIDMMSLVGSEAEKEKINPYAFVPQFIAEWKNGLIGMGCVYRCMPLEELHRHYEIWCFGRGVPSLDLESFFYAEGDEGYEVYVENRYAPGGDMWIKRQKRMAAIGGAVASEFVVSA